MSKSAITKLFVGGIVAVVAGIFLTVAAGLIAYFGGAFVMNGADVVGVTPTPQAWTFIFLGLVGILAFIGGAISGLVAWIGALLNTAQLQDKTWFVLLLVLGLLSFGFVAMLAYVIAGPDSTRQTAPVSYQPAS
jgi:glucan phosphoethanolaminetransferase (alkaline phosphatase superfamily)